MLLRTFRARFKSLDTVTEFSLEFFKWSVCDLLSFLYCSNMANALASATCERCKGGFAPAEKIVNSNGELYHEQCFVCAQCFQQFPEGLFYEVGRTGRSVDTAPPFPSPLFARSVLLLKTVLKCYV